jgi:hypothetical protein
MQQRISRTLARFERKIKRRKTKLDQEISDRIVQFSRRNRNPLRRIGLVLGRLYRDGLGVPQDYLLAYMWFNLAAPYLFGDTARAERDKLSAKMTPEQINKAQQLTNERNSHCAR